MKKIFNYLLIVTLLIGTAVSFSSCKDDDDDDEKKGNGYSIVGTWKYADESYYEVYTFNSDGTFVTTEADVSVYLTATEYGTYTYSNNKITLHYTSDYEEDDVVAIKWIDKDHFVMDGDDFYRQ